MRTPASENQDAIALLTKDQLWDMLAEAENAMRASAEILREYRQENIRMNTKGLEEECRSVESRPLKDWPSDLLFWLWRDGTINDIDTSGRVEEMITTEMNARGEGERVAV